MVPRQATPFGAGRWFDRRARGSRWFDELDRICSLSFAISVCWSPEARGRNQKVTHLAKRDSFVLWEIKILRIREDDFFVEINTDQQGLLFELTEV